MGRKKLSPSQVVFATIEDDKFYRVKDLQSVLRDLGLPFSIYTIRDYETWKCLDYTCGHRNIKKVVRCELCKGRVREPIIFSPRTPGSGLGAGHRRYTGAELKRIVQIFKERRVGI